MPNTRPPTTTAARFSAKQHLYRSHSLVNWGLFLQATGTASQGNRKIGPHAIRPAGLKIYLAQSPAGLGAELVKTMSRFAELAETQVTLGLNYASARLGRKDLLKIQSHQLPEWFLQHLSLMAPGVTIKEIRDYKVTRKIVTEPPEILSGLMKCPNPRGMTNSETACSTSFHCVEAKPPVFICHYCERHFRLPELEPHTGNSDKIAI